MRSTLWQLAGATLLCFASFAAAEDAAPPPEAAALLELAADDANTVQARAAALRVLADAESVPSGPLADLARDAKPGVLRRLALAALVATASDAELVGTAIARALTDATRGVRREALIAVTVRASECARSRDAVTALLRDDDPVLRAHAARAIAALADEAVDVSNSIDALLPLLADEDAGPLAARALVAARPSGTQLAPHVEALDAMVRARAGPVPAAIVLSAWLERTGRTWEESLGAFVETGSPNVAQAAWYAIGVIHMARAGAGAHQDCRACERRFRALLGPDSLIVAAALRDTSPGAVPAPFADRLRDHESKLVRTLATRDDDQ